MSLDFPQANFSPPRFTESNKTQSKVLKLASLWCIWFYYLLLTFKSITLRLWIAVYLGDCTELQMRSEMQQRLKIGSTCRFKTCVVRPKNVHERLSFFDIYWTLALWLRDFCQFFSSCLFAKQPSSRTLLISFVMNVKDGAEEIEVENKPRIVTFNASAASLENRNWAIYL